MAGAMSRVGTKNRTSGRGTENGVALTRLTRGSQEAGRQKRQT